MNLFEFLPRKTYCLPEMKKKNPKWFGVKRIHNINLFWKFPFDEKTFFLLIPTIPRGFLFSEVSCLFTFSGRIIFDANPPFDLPNRSTPWKAQPVPWSQMVIQWRPPPAEPPPKTSWTWPAIFLHWWPQHPPSERLNLLNGWPQRPSRVVTHSKYFKFDCSSLD